jgi:hypothetical protein
MLLWRLHSLIQGFGKHVQQLLASIKDVAAPSAAR